MMIPPRNAERISFVEAGGDLRPEAWICAEEIATRSVNPELNFPLTDENDALPHSLRRPTPVNPSRKTIQSP
jgi:hypothetical protein